MAKKEPNLNIFFIYILVIVIMDLIFYPLFPILLNYPPGSINTQFDIEFSKIPYYQQYIIVSLIIVIFGYICFIFAFKDINKWSYIIECIKTNDLDKIKKIRKKSFKLPHVIVLVQILIPVISVGVLFIILGFRNKADINFFMILMANLILVGEVSYLFSKNFFRQVLKITFIDESNIEKTRIGLQFKIFIQIIPLFIFSLLIFIFLGRAGLAKEKGDLLFNSYRRELEIAFEKGFMIENEDQIKQYLNVIKMKNENDILFFIDPLGNYKTSDNSGLSKFFRKYTQELAFTYGGHTYDYYGSDYQGTVIKLKGVNGDWIFGVKYQVSPRSIKPFIVGFIVLSLLAVFIILYFGKTIVDDISLIASGLNEIAEGEETELRKIIPVTSSDEIGDLVIAFNKVQDREKKYVHDLKNHQKIIIEQEKLASLGQMISGITHNLKTPIISLSVAIDTLKDLVTEYRSSIGDQRVTNKDHHEIANEMSSWLSEMKPYCDYMTDVLATVKGQIISTASGGIGFTLKELIKRVEIITQYELTKSGCLINYDIKADNDLIIPGEISDLVQVIENLISNSIQAYRDKGGVLQFSVIDQRVSLEFQIKDYGMGIPEQIQSRLFKEIITTKGKKGTGLGLYISFAIVKGKFGGDIWFESKEGKGSTFHVIIPISNIEKIIC